MTAREALYGYELAFSARSESEGTKNDAVSPYCITTESTEFINGLPIKKCDDGISLLDWLKVGGLSCTVAIHDGYIVGEGREDALDG